MIDLTELLLFTQVIIELAALFLALSEKDGKNKKEPAKLTTSGYFLIHLWASRQNTVSPCAFIIDHLSQIVNDPLWAFHPVK